MTKLSAVISAYNEEAKIEECIKSALLVADEVIVVNNTSTDRTEEIAEKSGAKVFTRPNNPMLNINKNYGFEKASGQWILNLDADERVTPELADEIKELLKSEAHLNGYFIPRKNIIFGKWIEHTGWYPDYQLRLFIKGEGRFAEQHVHELIQIEGEARHLNSPMIHYNYETVTQFLHKLTNIYTTNEAENMLKNGYDLQFTDLFVKPVAEFTRRFFYHKGYKDGVHGLVLSLLMAFYHLVVFVRLWELKGFPEKENSLKILEDGMRLSSKEMRHWMYEVKIQDSKSSSKKAILKVKRKLGRV